MKECIDISSEYREVGGVANKYLLFGASCNNNFYLHYRGYDCLRLFCEGLWS